MGVENSTQGRALWSVKLKERITTVKHNSIFIVFTIKYCYVNTIKIQLCLTVVIRSFNFMLQTIRDGNREVFMICNFHQIFFGWSNQQERSFYGPSPLLQQSYYVSMWWEIPINIMGRIRWAGHIAYIGERKDVVFWLGNLREKRQLWRLRSRWKMLLKWIYKN